MASLIDWQIETWEDFLTVFLHRIVIYETEITNLLSANIKFSFKLTNFVNMKKEWCLPSPFGCETMKETKNPDIRKNKKETLFPTVVDNLLDKETHFCFMIWDKKKFVSIS